MTDEEIPHVVVDPWGRGDVVGRKIDPPYGLVITAISDLRGWLRNCAEQTNTDEAGKEYKELVIPEIKILALIDKLQGGRRDLPGRAAARLEHLQRGAERGLNLLHLGAERGLKQARRRIRELRLLNKGLRLAIRNVAKNLEQEGL